MFSTTRGYPPGPPTPPNGVVSSLWILYARLRLPEEGSETCSRNVLIPVAIFVYVSRGWQPCLAPREVILQAPYAALMAFKRFAYPPRPPTLP